MRMFSLLTSSLLAVVLMGATHQGSEMKALGRVSTNSIFVPAAIRALDAPLSQFDDRFGNMVAEVPCTVPYTFVNGTVAQAGQVNANFQALMTCLSTIYASDIIPSSAAQATFGGTLQYTFPAGVAVAGGQSNAYTTTSGTVWLTSSGAVSGAYAINLGTVNCGNSGLMQVQNNNTAEDTFACNGNITNNAGSIFGGAITANNGNFIAGSGGVLLCPGGSCAAASQLKVDTTGAVTASGPIYGSLNGGPSPIPSASPNAPAGLCYKSNGAPCDSRFHEVWDTSTTAPLATCTPGIICPGATAVNFPFAFTDAFYTCYGDGLTALVLPVFVNTNTLQATYQVYNGTGANLFGSQTVYWDCRGR